MMLAHYSVAVIGKGSPCVDDFGKPPKVLHNSVNIIYNSTYIINVRCSEVVVVLFNYKNLI